MLHAGDGFDEAGAEGEHIFKRQLHQVVFGFAFYAGPHGAAFLGAVGAGAGYIDERHAGVVPNQRSSHMQREGVRYLGVVGFLHTDRRYTQAEEAGVVSLELVFYGRQVIEITVNNFLSLGCVMPVDLRVSTSTSLMRSSPRHICITPSPTMPVTPVTITFIFLVYV